MKRCSYLCLKITGFVFETTTFCFTAVPYFNNSLIIVSLFQLYGVHGTPPHPPDCVPSTICLVLCTLPKADAGTRTAHDLGFFYVAVNHVWQRHAFYFLLLFFPEVLIMQFAVWVEHQPCCV